jgi:hypothetical protein
VPVYCGARITSSDSCSTPAVPVPSLSRHKEIDLVRPVLLARLAFTALPLLLAACGSASTRSASAPSTADQALMTAQQALAEAKAARAAAEAANAKADQILTTVRAGPRNDDMAAQALQSAKSAQQAADEARRVAMEAQDAATRLDTKTDRMFQKSMRK